ncbi:hypothetical protein DFS34DRAFT_632157 [Phlyctochytrium arcticum]|nr:hypothetical protein DFS34DRAFT_632157 [Phlyctochytrium arcticum]
MIVLGTLFFTLCYFVSLHVFFDMLYVDLESFCWLCCHNDVRLLDISILINILLCRSARSVMCPPIFAEFYVFS